MTISLMWKGVDYGKCQKVAQEEDRETQTSKETKA
jgi:hypothetical protein